MPKEPGGPREEDSSLEKNLKETQVLQESIEVPGKGAEKVSPLMEHIDNVYIQAGKILNFLQSDAPGLKEMSLERNNVLESIRKLREKSSMKYELAAIKFLIDLIKKLKEGGFNETAEALKRMQW
jgi:hypothetical protein